jgi:predicted metal-dependent peptidase
MLLHGETTCTDAVPTAATDGINTYFNPEFVQTLDDKELLFVAIHECMHKVYKHLFIWKKLRKEDPLLTNMANDYVINPMIRDLDPEERFLCIPRYKDGPKKGEVMCLIDDNFEGMDTKQVIDILRKENEENPQGEGDEGDEGDEGGDSDPEYSEKIMKRAEDQHDDHNYGEDGDTEEASIELDRAIRQAVEVAGAGADGVAREIMKLLAVETPWQDILAEFIKQQVKGGGQTTWRKYNRRLIGSDIYMPSMLDERAGSMVVAIDTSGSIPQDILTKFLSELKAIVTDVVPEKLHLMYWGSTVCAEETYDEMTYANLEDSTKPKGGGGTRPACVQERVGDGVKTGAYQNLDAVIVLTDGYFYGDKQGEWEQLGIPVLWAVLEHGGNASFTPKFGSLIKVK